MIKRLVSSMVLVTLLCGPALASGQAATLSSIELGPRVDWRTHGGEIHRTSVLVAHGSSFDLDGGSATLIVTRQ